MTRAVKQPSDSQKFAYAVCILLRMVVSGQLWEPANSVATHLVRSLKEITRRQCSLGKGNFFISLCRIIFKSEETTSSRVIKLGKVWLYCWCSEIIKGSSLPSNLNFDQPSNPITWWYERAVIKLGPVEPLLPQNSFNWLTTLRLIAWYESMQIALIITTSNILWLICCCRWVELALLSSSRPSLVTRLASEGKGLLISSRVICFLIAFIFFKISSINRCKISADNATRDEERRYCSFFFL